MNEKDQLATPLSSRHNRLWRALASHKIALNSSSILFAALRIFGGAIRTLRASNDRETYPTRHDLPLVLSVGFLMMALFTLLMHLV